MAIVMGLDQHRAQITAEWIDTATGEIARSRVAPAHRESVRRFVRRFRGQELEVALEATTGWRFVVEELRRAGARVHLAEPAETSALRDTGAPAQISGSDPFLRDDFDEPRVNHVGVGGGRPARGRRVRVGQDQSVGPAGTRIEVLDRPVIPSRGSHTASASGSVSAANARSGEALMLGRRCQSDSSRARP
jgi:hypothetical protein